MKKLVIYLIASTALLSACSSNEKKEEVKQEVSQEPVVNKAEYKQNSRDYIAYNDKLNEQQKKELLELFDKTTAAMKSTNEKILQTKTVMIKSLMEPKQDESKISILRKDLKNLEKKRMDTTLRAFDQAKIILTPVKDLETRQKLYEDFMIREGHYY